MLVGNTDNDRTKTNMFDPPIVAQYIRIIPLVCRKACTLRMELVGCELNGDCRSTNHYFYFKKFCLLTIIRNCPFESIIPSFSIISHWPQHDSALQHIQLQWSAGHEVTSHLWRAAFSIQCLPHLGYWRIYLAPLLCSSGQARQD